jgi:uncharacterized protein (DUF362 family)
MTWVVADVAKFDNTKKSLTWHEKLSNPQGAYPVVIVGGSFETFIESCYLLTFKALQLLKENDKNFSISVDSLSDKNVLVKPNLTQPPGFMDKERRQRGFNTGINTNVYAVQAVVDFLLENKAAKILIGESVVWTPGETPRAYDECGYSSLFKDQSYEGKVSLVDLRTELATPELASYGRTKLIDKPDLRCKISLKGTDYERIVADRIKDTLQNTNLDINQIIQSNLNSEVNKLLNDIHFFVSVGKLKTHTQAIISGAVKNRYGLLEPPPVRHIDHMKIDPLMKDHTRYELALSYEYLTTRIANVAAALHLFFKSKNIPELDILEGGWFALEGDGPLYQGHERRESVVISSFNSPATADLIALEFMFNDMGEIYSQRFAKIAEKFLLRKGVPLDSEVGQKVIENYEKFYPLTYANQLGLGPIDLNELKLILASTEKEPSSILELRKGGLFRNTTPFKEGACLCRRAYDPLFNLKPALKDEKIIVVTKKAIPEEFQKKS